MFGTIANKKKTLKELVNTISISLKNEKINDIYNVKYNSDVEKFVSDIYDDIYGLLPENKKYLARWIALKILDENDLIYEAIKTNFDIDIRNNLELQEKLSNIKDYLKEKNLSFSSLRDTIVMSIVYAAEDIRKKVCKFTNNKYKEKDRKIDKILTSKKFGIPIMLIFLALIFWLTIAGANYPSKLLSSFFGMIQDKLFVLFEFLHVPEFWTNLLILRNVSDCNLGSFSYASAYGYIFPFIYFT